MCSWVYCPELVAIFFDESGDLLGVERRHLEFLVPRGGMFDIYDERIPPFLQAWQDEIDFCPEVIQVRKFFIMDLGIEDYPDHFDEILNDPAASDDEKAGIREAVRRWDADGQFVLIWGNDYWLDSTGEVVSS